MHAIEAKKLIKYYVKLVTVSSSMKSACSKVTMMGTTGPIILAGKTNTRFFLCIHGLSCCR